MTCGFAPPSIERLRAGAVAKGQPETKTDRNGTVHGYDYDRLGRELHDRILDFASHIDNQVKRLSRSYNQRGLLATIGSYYDDAVGADREHGLTFHQADLETLANELRSQGYAIELNLHSGGGCVDEFVDEEPYGEDHHLKLCRQGQVVTSIGIVVARPR